MAAKGPASPADTARPRLVGTDRGDHAYRSPQGAGWLWSRAERGVEDVRWFIPHQANVRIIHAASDVLGFHRDAVFKNLDRYGNTSGGSIPIALDELYRAGGIRRGDLLLTSGFGAGLTWGTALWRW